MRSFIPYQPYGAKLPLTPWLWAYWPVMKVARAGQQSGNESTASAKVVPFFARSFRTFGISFRSAADMSSVITTRMFGLPSLSAELGRACAVLAPSAATRATAAPARASLARLPSSSMILILLNLTCCVTLCQLDGEHPPISA